MTFYKARIILTSTTKPEKLNNATKDDFECISKEIFTHKNNNYYKVYTENTDEYFWLVLEYNNPSPRRDTILDTETKQEKKNARSPTEVELIKQGFFLYHYEKQILYIKNYDDKKILLDILKENNKNNKYRIDSFYQDSEHFVKTLDSIQEIRFADANGLFGGGLRKTLNIDQDSQPDDFVLSLKYKDKSKKSILSFIKNLFDSNNNLRIKDLLIKGKDENNFGVIFNQNTFFQKITIKPLKTNENIWDKESVKEKLLEAIYDN